MCANERDDLMTVPFGRSDLAADLATITADDQGRWQADDPEFARCLTGLVDVDTERAKVEFLVEFLDDCRPLSVDRERQHKELGCAEFSLEPIQGRHFSAARYAPRCPDIQKDWPTAEISKRQAATLAIVEPDIGQRLRAIEERETKPIRGTDRRILQSRNNSKGLLTGTIGQQRFAVAI